MPITEILMPQLGVNDDTVMLLAWLASPGQKVQAGDEIATLETTKATFGLQAEVAGHVYPIVAAGTEVPVRAVLGLMTDQPGERVVEEYTALKAAQEMPQPEQPPDASEGRTMTARALIRISKPSVSSSSSSLRSRVVAPTRSSRISRTIAPPRS